MKKWIGVIGMVLLGVALPAAAEHSMAGMEMKKGATQATHQGAGKVVSINRAMQKIKLAHEPIESLGWPAMTMNFNVTKGSLLEGIKAGDAIMFDLEQGSKPGEWLIGRIMPHGAKK